MRFRNGKKKVGLIALLSCVFTATVAFAAYTGYNYINGSVTVEGSPFKMVFATDTSDSATVFESEDGVIPASSAQINGSAEATDMTVKSFDSANRVSRIQPFTITLKEKGDSAAYSFAIKNTGGATAYLKDVTIEHTDMPKDGAGATTSGLDYSVILRTSDGDACILKSSDGERVFRSPDGTSYNQYITVAPGESITVVVGAAATDPTDDNPSLFAAWDADGGDDQSGAYGAEITLGQISMEWSAVDPSQA